MEDNDVGCSDETIERAEELKNRIGQRVFYNNELYTISDVIMSAKVDVVDDKEFKIISKNSSVILTPVHRICVKGEDIMNIKNIATQLIYKKDGGMEFEKIPDDGQEKNEDGFIVVHEE